MTNEDLDRIIGTGDWSLLCATARTLLAAVAELEAELAAERLSAP